MHQLQEVQAQQQAQQAQAQQVLSTAHLGLLGWARHVDPVSGRPFYHHATTGVVSWLPPGWAPPPVAQPIGASAEHAHVSARLPSSLV